MATIFIVLVLTVLVLNAIIMRSTTPWWRDPASLFRRSEESPEPDAPLPAPVDDDPKRAADWVRAAQARAAEMARTRAVSPPPAAPVGPESRRATDPRELAPRRAAEAAGAGALRAGAPSRHAVRTDDEASTEVFTRIPDEDAPTRLLARVPAGQPDGHRAR